MFNTRLREMRIKRGFTQQYMADSINVQVRSYQHYEEGKRSPSFDLLVKLADTLDVSLDYLFGRDEFMKAHGVSFDE